MHTQDLAELLNPWQRRFPLVERPFAHIAGPLGLTEAAVIDAFAAARHSGLLSRLGGVFDPRAGGDSLLCAVAVPAARLDAVAAEVSALPGVNHNYAREDRLNLWFVLTGSDRASNARTLEALERRLALPIVRLRMLRAYRIDLGFDLRGVPDRDPFADTATVAQPVVRLPRPDPDTDRCTIAHPGAAPSGHRSDTLSAPLPPLPAEDLPLAALAEQGLPLQPRPYRGWAQALGHADDRAVRSHLAAWLADGRLRRFGAVLRHHEAGIACNAMTVFDVPDTLRDACGLRLAAQPGVTLAYARERAPGWSFNLYCMVHGRDRDAVRARIAAASAAAGLAPWPQRVLFSSHRYKQTGARRFTLPGPVAATGTAGLHPEESRHVAC